MEKKEERGSKGERKGRKRVFKTTENKRRKREKGMVLNNRIEKRRDKVIKFSTASFE